MEGSGSTLQCQSLRFKSQLARLSVRGNTSFLLNHVGLSWAGSSALVVINSDYSKLRAVVVMVVGRQRVVMLSVWVHMCVFSPFVLVCICVKCTAQGETEHSGSVYEEN